MVPVPLNTKEAETMQCITIKLKRGDSIEKLGPQLKKKLLSALASEWGRKGGQRATPAKRAAAFRREAVKRAARGQQ